MSNTDPNPAPTAPPLSWSRSDPEERLGFTSRPYTSVNTLYSLLYAMALTVIFYVILAQLPNTRFAMMFTQRGPTPYFIVLLTAWSLVILRVKSQKLRLQKRSLSYEVVPDDPTFALTPQSAENIIERIYAIADDPRRFVLYNRILVALGNLKNLGRIPDVDDILRSQAEHDEQTIETSYSLLRGFIWAVPVLGFIGTVLGLSSAVGGFGEVLSQADDIKEISSSLQGVTSGLSTAFETTLEALVAALCIQLIATFVKKSEQEFLESCNEYCLTRIVSNLRLLPDEKAPTS